VESLFFLSYNEHDILKRNGMAQPIIGYRAWKVGRKDGVPFLSAKYQKYVWAEGKLEAICLRTSGWNGMRKHQNSCPDIECDCGIYGLASLRAAHELNSPVLGSHPYVGCYLPVGFYPPHQDESEIPEDDAEVGFYCHGAIKVWGKLLLGQTNYGIGFKAQKGQVIALIEDPNHSSYMAQTLKELSDLRGLPLLPNDEKIVTKVMSEFGILPPWPQYLEEIPEAKGTYLPAKNAQ
jgi:hypothetical protein